MSHWHCLGFHGTHVHSVIKWVASPPDADRLTFEPWDMDHRYGSAPWWAAAAATAALPTWRAVAWLSARRRRRQGRCPGCGYDLRASPVRCPECGAPAKAGRPAAAVASSVASSAEGG